MLPNKTFDERAGYYLNFDLAFPSQAIPSDFFPSNQTLYGYTARLLFIFTLIWVINVDDRTLVYGIYRMRLFHANRLGPVDGTQLH